MTVANGENGSQPKQMRMSEIVSGSAKKNKSMENRAKRKIEFDKQELSKGNRSQKRKLTDNRNNNASPIQMNVEGNGIESRQEKNFTQEIIAAQSNPKVVDMSDYVGDGCNVELYPNENESDFGLESEYECKEVDEQRE